MRNTLAIAQREMNAYFASPIAYVLIGFFALLFGWFFYVPLAYFAEQSGQAGMNPTQALNMNQMLVGPTFIDRKSTRLNSSHLDTSRMPSSA